MLAGLMLSLNAIFVYVGRSGLTEAFCLGFFCLGLFFGEIALRTRTVWPALLTGVMIGCVMLVRPDGYIAVVFPLFAVFVLIGDEKPAYNSALAMLSAVTTFFIWSVVDLWWFSYPYFSDLRTLFRLSELIWASGILIALSWIAIFTRLFCLNCADKFGFISNVTLRGAYISVFIVGISFICLFIRAIVVIESGSIARKSSSLRAPLEMTWYSTVPMMLLAFAGAFALLKRSKLQAVPLVVAGMSSIMVFLIFSKTAADHPWGARRWLPFAIPLIILFALVVLEYLSSRYRRIGLVVASCICALYLVHQDRIARNWWFVQLQSDLKPQFDQIASTLTQTNAEFFAATPSPVASVLNYVYGIPTVSISAPRVRTCGFHEVPDLPRLCAKTLSFEHGRKKVSLFGKRNKIVETCLNPIIFAYMPQRKGEYCTD